MPDRLTPLDVSFLNQEDLAAPMHVGNIAVFEAPGLEYGRLVELVHERIATVPRFRQRLLPVPGRLANPVWVDDTNFDIDFHVRRSALPRPGSLVQLRELAGRILSRQLDRSRPLWEVYLVEGLEDGRVAVLTKTHHALVDGARAVDVLSVILDTGPESPAGQLASLRAWRPAPAPSGLQLVSDAISDTLRRPGELVDTVRLQFQDVRSLANRAIGIAGGLLRTASRLVEGAAGASEGPLAARAGGQHRRIATVETELADYKRIRKAHGGTVNDAVLATLAGGLRAWLLTRGEPVTTKTTVRVLVPVTLSTPQAVVEPGPEETAATDSGPGMTAGPWGSGVGAYLLDLPVGEPNPVVRLHQISYRMKAHSDTGRAVGAEALVHLSGFAPSTLHTLGARVAMGLSRRLYNLAVTNVPGPQAPLYAAGVRLLQVYPVVPLAPGQAVSVGVTSYDGGVYYGLNADLDAMPDADILAQCLAESLAELLEAT